MADRNSSADSGSNSLSSLVDYRVRDPPVLSCVPVDATSVSLQIKNPRTNMANSFSSFRRLKRLLPALTVLSVAAACVNAGVQGSAAAAGAAATQVYPGATWDSISNPEALGWSRERLDSVHARLHTLPTTG